jgi:hypothetical protein
MLKFAALTTLAVMTLTASAFADSRHQSQTYTDSNGWRSPRSTSVEGRITDVDRDRNGFVIRLDRGGLLLYVDRQTDVDSATRRRVSVRDLDRGDYIRATGSIERGAMYVRDIDLLRDDDRPSRHDRYDRRNDESRIAGVVERIDERREVLYVREARSNRIVTVDADKARGRNIRRGDFVTVIGEWDRNGNFDAVRIEAR